MTYTILDLAQKGEEMGSLHGRLEPDVPEEISCPKARLHKASDWSSRRLEVQCFGVVRHASRADTIGATWKGTPGNVLQTAFELSVTFYMMLHDVSCGCCTWLYLVGQAMRYQRSMLI